MINFGLLTARMQLGQSWAYGCFGLLPAHELFGSIQAQYPFQPVKSPGKFLAAAHVLLSLLMDENYFMFRPNNGPR